MTALRPATNPGRPDRVLIVDDEPVIHELVSEVLDPAETISALSVAEARAIVEANEPFDVALVDKNLPDGSGLDFVRWLRTARPDAEVVIITAYPSMDSAVEAVALGATDYLIKPMRDINELRLRVGNACTRARQQRAEVALLAALRDSEERYRELFEASPDAILVLDTESRVVTDANSAAERLYGRSRKALVGTPSAALSARDADPIVDGSVVRRRDAHASGTTFPVEVTTAIARRDGQSCVIEVIRDVSDRERAEAERGSLEKRLARAGRLEALGRLAAGVAHDVNNLLCVIRTNNELATESLDEGHIAREDLDQIEQAVASAADLTRRLLSFSGRQLVMPQVVDLNSQILTVSKLLRRTIESRAELKLELSPAPLFVKIDPGQLEQVITNLVVNARDAMPAGGSITVSTGLDATAQEVCLRIRDTGTGMPPEIIAEIFEPFFSTKGVHGTGLGLATVQEIVQRAGGRIAVESQQGRGTTFEIRIPVSQEDPRMLTDVVHAPIIGGRGEAVLIVEDDLGVREVTRRLLGGAGYAVHGVRTGEEALEHMRSHPIQLVIADVELPGMSGVDLAKRMTGARVMFTTGMASDPTRLEGRPFLPKPYSREDLLRCVRRTLDRP